MSTSKQVGWNADMDVGKKFDWGFAINSPFQKGYNSMRTCKYCSALGSWWRFLFGLVCLNLAPLALWKQSGNKVPCCPCCSWVWSSCAGCLRTSLLSLGLSCWWCCAACVRSESSSWFPRWGRWCGRFSKDSRRFSWSVDMYSLHSWIRAGWSVLHNL